MSINEQQPNMVSIPDDQDQETEKQGCGACLKAFFCKCTLKDNFKSLFKRKPSALAPLDGMRFMAVMWVFVLHNSLFTFQFFKCIDTKNWFWMLVINGEIGVDIFFVLSGFLICFILHREYDKYGDIDWSHFIKMRFLRLYPAMMSFFLGAFFFFVINGIPLIEFVKYAWPSTLFINNFVWTNKTHLWTIAAEMQFYLFSPWFVKKLIKYERPWIVPLGICIASTILNFAIVSGVCPQAWNDSNAWNEYNEDGSKNAGNCADIYWKSVYQQMLTRASPYGFGMYAALLHMRDTDHDYLNSKSSIIFEWLAFIIINILAFIGCYPSTIGSKIKNAPLVLVWTCISRQIYGAAFSYLTLLMLSPRPDEAIAWYRPVKYIRSLLSMNLWLPFANLTYTFYLSHTSMMIMLWPLNMVIFQGDKEIDWENLTASTACYFSAQETTKMWFTFAAITSVLTFISVILVYVIIEKQGINSRIVFKNKFEKNQEKRVQDELKNQNNLKIELSEIRPLT